MIREAFLVAVCIGLSFLEVLVPRTQDACKNAVSKLDTLMPETQNAMKWKFLKTSSRESQVTDLHNHMTVTMYPRVRSNSKHALRSSYLGESP